MICPQSVCCGFWGADEEKLERFLKPDCRKRKECENDYRRSERDTDSIF